MSALTFRMSYQMLHKNCSEPLCTLPVLEIPLTIDFEAELQGLKPC